MNTNENDAPAGFVYCPFRSMGRAAEIQSGFARQVICEAGGGFELGTSESMDAVIKICECCNIPATLNLPHACLFLVPFRIFRHDCVQSYYGCRWYFSINPQNAPKNIDWCRGCRDWFPRPPEYLIPGQISICHKFHRIFLNPPERTDHFSIPSEPRRIRWHERLRDLFYL